jgi:hypothetical protein
MGPAAAKRGGPLGSDFGAGVAFVKRRNGKIGDTRHGLVSNPIRRRAEMEQIARFRRLSQLWLQAACPQSGNIAARMEPGRGAEAEMSDQFIDL